jgi:chemotaxis signal transduction protein
MGLSVVPLQLRDIWLAVPAQAVQEILGERPWVTIAGAPPELPGVLAWRGRAIAVLDLGRLVDRGGALVAGESRRRTVVVQLDGCALAIPVDGVREVQVIAPEQVHPSHTTRQRFSDTEIQLDGVPMPLLDLDAMVNALAPTPASA